MCLVCMIAGLGQSSCGRGPVTPPIHPPFVATIQFQLYVNGQISPSQGNYIIAINTNVSTSQNVNSGFGETPGEPTAAEGQGTPPTYTHWDQRFVYGVSGVTSANGFLYQYKILTGGAGTTTVNFFNIGLNANDYTLIPNASFGTGSGNALSITLPLNDISIRPNTAGSNPPTIVTPPVVLIYVNYITTDASGVPQDQLGPNGLGTVGYQVPVDITHNNTVQLPNFSGVSGPPNPNLFIIGGQITVTAK
jgi:hypothetical protein